MFALTNKPEMASRLYKALVNLASDPKKGTDVMKLIQHLAGVFSETYMIFDHPDKAMAAGFEKLAQYLNTEPLIGSLAPQSLPPSCLIDRETERGRMAARLFFEDWLDCEFEFHNLMVAITHFLFVTLEEDGMTREESFRLLIETTKRCMTYEFAAQELCDIVIEKKIAQEGWHLSECISALSAIAGRYVASEDSQMNAAVPSRGLDQIVATMTQEAARLGVPVGSDWRFGLAANDVPCSAPMGLILNIEPYCETFFETLKITSYSEQAVCCAKAAGRMVAVAAGGDMPEIEPVIAKPLAMAALTETYRYLRNVPSAQVHP